MIQSPQKLETYDLDLIAQKIPPGSEVLDCGCGSGSLLTALAQRNCTVTGIDLTHRTNVPYSSVILGDLQRELTWSQLQSKKFDYVIFAHVIEHLTSPLPVIAFAQSVLKEQGKIVIALPNVATWRMRISLLIGKWEYQDEGILDRTHVHFYTWENVRRLIQSAGLEVLESYWVRLPANRDKIRQLFRAIVHRCLPLLMTYSFVAFTRPVDGAKTKMTER